MNLEQHSRNQKKIYRREKAKKKQKFKGAKKRYNALKKKELYKLILKNTHKKQEDTRLYYRFH